MRNRLVLPVLLLGFFMANPGWTDTVQVTVRSFEFDAPVVNVQVGDQVVWNLEDGFHNVAADDTSFRSGAPGANFPFSHTFTSAGSFDYHCEVHPFMQGTVNVVAAPPEPCVPSPTVLCLNSDRFQVEMTWRSRAEDPLVAAKAVPLDFAPSSGLFYFVGAENIEMLIKVLNACVPVLGNKYWVFFSATTNVEFHLTVTDTSTGDQKFYSNSLNHAASPIQDTNAFETCP
jgi:hypothetical protein